MSDLGVQTLSVINAPPVPPPAVGLVATCRLLGPDFLVDDTVESVDEIVNDSEGNLVDRPTTIEQRWVGGFRLLPEQRCALGTYRDICDDATQLSIPALGGSGSWTESIPGIVETGDTCSAFGFEAHDYRGRAERALLAVESKMLATEFWLGTVAKAKGWGNQYLAAGDDRSGGLVHYLNNAGAVSPGAALALLEEGIAQYSNGQPAAIHCTRQLGSALSELGNTFRDVGGLIYTYMGNVIIPDAGYPGSGPAGESATGATQWAFATGLPVIHRAPVEVIPEDFWEALDRSVNTVAFRALRYMSVFIPPCPLVAAQVTLQAAT